MAPSVRAKLFASESVRSLRAEHTIKDQLAAHGWSTHLGPYYEDPVDRKLRETDVVAHQRWHQRKNEDPWYVRLAVVVEAKSAKGWHVVFAGPPAERDIGHVLRVWAGHIGDQRSWLIELLNGGGVGNDRAVALTDRFIAAAFPDGMALVRKVFPEPPPIHPTASTFRETNIDKEKELETSVLWKATLSLRAATKAMRLHAEDWHKSYLKTIVDWPLPPGTYLEDQFLATARRHLTYVDSFHPVVVIEAPLWWATRKRLRPIRACRLCLTDAVGSAEWWCDVVNSDYFEQYVSTISAHYLRFFKRQRGVKVT